MARRITAERFAAATLMGLALVAASPALAQTTFPNQPLKLVIPASMLSMSS